LILYVKNENSYTIKLKHKADWLRISKGKGYLPDGGVVTFFTGISIEHLKYYEYLLE